MTTLNTTTLQDQLFQTNHDKAIYDQVVGYAYEYLDTVRERNVFPTPEALANLAQFDEEFPQTSQDAEAVLRLLHEVGSPSTVAQGGGRYFGFVNGNIIPASLAARWLADAWDQNASLYVMSPIAAKLEQICERWLVDLFGLPQNTAAGFVTGTSTATMLGALAARNVLLKKHSWDANERGIFGAPPIRVVMSKDAHSSVIKGLAVIGIGKQMIEFVPVDAQGRLDASQLPELDSNTLVILQAGNVASGAFDPFVEVCTKAREAGAWVHVDGAFGLWAAGSESTQHLTHGIELADSWSVDAHKTLNAPYDCGLVLCKQRADLVNALTASGSYLVFSENRDAIVYGIEMSRRARGIELWALLKSLGRNGVDALIAQLCANARLFAEELQAQGFRVLNDVVFNQVLVACDTPELTQKTLKYVQDSGECWCGGVQWKGESVIRLSVCSWATTADDIRFCTQTFVKARQKAQLG
jgi:glutamate/tyrosine decarboxylase-like PLP-dependent enzyme